MPRLFFLKAKAKAKDMKIVQGQHQGQLIQLPLRANRDICLSNKTQCKRIDLWRFWCSMLIIKKSSQSHMGP